MTDKFIKKLELTPFVYQYTSMEALFTILEGCRKANETKANNIIPFRASCIYNVNDPRGNGTGVRCNKEISSKF